MAKRTPVTLNDGLRNALTGGGTSIDKRMNAFWYTPSVSYQQVLDSYRTSWIMRRAIDLPVKDMTRAGRDIQLDADKISVIERQERKWKIKSKLREALILGRLGGGAIIIGGPGLPEQPLGQIGKGQLRYLHVVSRHELSFGNFDRDIASPFYGEPVSFRVNGENATASIHPSRVIPFKGIQCPRGLNRNHIDEYWGDPLYLTLQDAVKNAELTQNGFASLVDATTIDVVKMDLISILGRDDHEKKIQDRVDLVTTSASIHRKMVMDITESLERFVQSFQGMPEMMMATLGMVAAATGIPATKFIGKSPDGQNATGDSDDQNWSATVAELQDSELRPIMDRLDPILMGDAGLNEPDMWYEFSPLSVMTEKQKAEIAKLKADTVSQYAANGTVDIDALSKAVETMLIEDGTFPGLEQSGDAEFDEGDVEGEV